jgi:hypothetical protein
MTIQERIFAQLSKNSKKKLSKQRINLDLFADYKDRLQEAKDNFYIASGEMESLAIELEQKENEMLRYREEYFSIYSDYTVDVESKLRELGLDSLPDNWTREFDRVRADIPDVESIKGIVDTVKTQFR